MDNKRYDAYGNEFEISQSDFELTQVDKKIHDKKFETKATTFGKDALKRFCKNKSSVVAAIIIGLLMLLSFILPVVSPYNIDPSNPNIKETKMLPKIFEYKPTGVLGHDVANNPNDWKVKWRGAEIITEVRYDPDLKLPFNMTATGEKNYYSKYAVKDLDYYGYYTNSSAKGSYGGIYILKNTKKGNNQKLNLIIYQELDYTDDENFTLELNFADDVSPENEDFKELYATIQGDFRVVFKYQDNNGNDKQLELKPMNNDYTDLNINISELMAENGISVAKKGQIIIELNSSSKGNTYLPIESLFLTSNSEEMVTIDKQGTYSKQDILKMMSMTNDGTDVQYDDAAQKLRYGKLETGVYPIAYWRTNAEKAVYRAYIYLCDFVLDTYENTYGIKETLDITLAKITEYEANGWCDYNYYQDAEGNWQYDFKVLDAEKCPVESVKKVDFALVEVTRDGQIVEVLSQQLTCDVTMYKYLGYESMPKYLLGTDDRGFDIIVYSFNGLKKSFLISIIVSAICLSFGLVWGSISGYFGGNVDLFMERFCEILSGVPSTVVITLVVLLLGDTIVTFGLALCMTGWLGIAGRTRTQFYRFKGREYILASRTLGSSDMRLIFKHILPNSLGTIVTSSVLSIPSVIFSEASLSYLGILKGSNSFGTVLSHNQQYISTRPMLIVFPAIIISLIMISFNLFGNGLRDALNPSLKGSE